MTSVGHNSKYQWENTHLAASWDGATLTVRSQRLPADADRTDDGRISDELPCAAPAGGWHLGATQDLPGVDKIESVVGAQFGADAMVTPFGGPTNVNGANQSYNLDDTVQVALVGVTGDPAAATAAIRTVFAGNLCVVHSANRAVDVNAQVAAFGKLTIADWQRYGITGTSTIQRPTGTPSLIIDAAVDTPEVRKLAAGLGRPAVGINPFIRPDG